MPRLFIALRPPPPMRDALDATMEGVAGARWQDDEQLHLTLRFLGEVDRHLADDVALGMSQIVAPPPSLSVDGVGTFETRGHPHSLWARIPATADLDHVRSRVDGMLRRIGVQPDARAFVPHVTLARLSRSAGPCGAWIATHAGLRVPAMPFGHVYLYESVLAREGATYSVICRQALG